MFVCTSILNTPQKRCPFLFNVRGVPPFFIKPLHIPCIGSNHMFIIGCFVLVYFCWSCPSHDMAYGPRDKSRENAKDSDVERGEGTAKDDLCCAQGLSVDSSRRTVVCFSRTTVQLNSLPWLGVQKFKKKPMCEDARLEHPQDHGARVLETFDDHLYQKP